MFNSDFQLDPKLFNKDVEMASMRAAFGEGLVIAGQKDKNVVALCADLTESVGLQNFKSKFPDRFIEVGVAEQNLATVASGMATMGKIPFMSSYAVFSPGRNWEQIRTTICLNNLPVKIIGTHFGVNVGADGGSHQALEDIALMRVLPRMVVISPCDTIETVKAVIAAAKTKDPTYIRLPREKSPIITTEETSFEIGKASLVFEASPLSRITTRPRLSHHEASPLPPRGLASIGIIATGPLLHKALKVAKKLEEEGDNVIVMNLSTIKPLDEASIIRLAHETKGIVTVEEHQIAGGMGSAVAECLAQHFPIPIEFVGVKDKFGQSGKPDELLELYEMGEKNIYAAVKRVMLRKS